MLKAFSYTQALLPVLLNFNKSEIYLTFTKKVKMYQRIYYSNSGTPWTKEEETQLQDRYVNQRLTISEIGDIHKRTPGGIGYQLKRMNLIVTNEEARGYEEYRSSALYKEIVSKTIENKNKAKEDEYTRIGEVWDPTESEQLIEEYVKQELSLLEISKIHKRNPTGIAAQLYKLDIVKSKKWYGAIWKSNV
jgi:hypothetical protein